MLQVSTVAPVLKSNLGMVSDLGYYMPGVVCFSPQLSFVKVVILCDDLFCDYRAMFGLCNMLNSVLSQWIILFL